MPAKKPAKKTEIALVREDLEALQDQCNALAARVAYLETFRPAVEVVSDQPVVPWWRRIFGRDA